MPKAKSSMKNDEYEQQIGELTADLQRLRADFENYRKQVEREKTEARTAGSEKTVVGLLPVIDTIDRAVAHMPADIADHPWAKGIVSLSKQLQKMLDELHLTRINAQPGIEFDPEVHQAALFDDSSEGDTDVIAEELQAGYLLNDRPVRHAVVKVAKK